MVERKWLLKSQVDVCARAFVKRKEWVVDNNMSNHHLWRITVCTVPTFKPHIILWVVETSLNLILRWGNWGSEKLSNLSKITQQGQGLIAGTRTQAYVAPQYEFCGCFRCTLPHFGIFSSHVPWKFSQFKKWDFPLLWGHAFLVFYCVLTPV